MNNIDKMQLKEVIDTLKEHYFNDPMDRLLVLRVRERLDKIIIESDERDEKVRKNNTTYITPEQIDKAWQGVGGDK